jgi:hypothetical protein
MRYAESSEYETIQNNVSGVTVKIHNLNIETGRPYSKYYTCSILTHFVPLGTKRQLSCGTQYFPGNTRNHLCIMF